VRSCGCSARLIDTLCGQQTIACTCLHLAPVEPLTYSRRANSATGGVGACRRGHRSAGSFAICQPPASIESGVASSRLYHPAGFRRPTSAQRCSRPLQDASSGGLGRAVLTPPHLVDSDLLGWRSEGCQRACGKARCGLLQVVNAGEIGFSRAIGIASAKYIRDHHQQFGGPKPPPLTHDGIDDAFVGKASTVWYWYRGKWLQLQGAD
jgi:hypothetical protein